LVGRFETKHFRKSQSKGRFNLYRFCEKAIQLFGARFPLRVRTKDSWLSFVIKTVRSLAASTSRLVKNIQFVKKKAMAVKWKSDGNLTDLGLIDEYCLYFRPFVLGSGKPHFAGARPPLRLVATDPVGEDAVRLTFVPT
jgi:hypothetical protein